MFSRRANTSSSAESSSLLSLGAHSPTGKSKHGVTLHPSASTLTLVIVVFLAVILSIHLLWNLIFTHQSLLTSPHSAFTPDTKLPTVTNHEADSIVYNKDHSAADFAPLNGMARSTLLVPSPLDPSVNVHPDIAQLLQHAVDGIDAIPNIAHFVIGTVHGSQNGRSEGVTVTSPVEFTIQNWLAIKSANDIGGFANIYCHVAAEPDSENDWWKLAKPLCSHTVHVRDVTSVFGRPVYHRQHKSDILRLEALLNYGGIAIDNDVILVKSLSDSATRSQWLNVDLLLGQAQSSTKSWADRIDASIIAARKESWMLKEWFNTYRMFESHNVIESQDKDTSVTVYHDDLNAFMSDLAQALSSLRPHLHTLAPVEWWGKPLAREMDGALQLYNGEESLSEQSVAVHLWQGEAERRREETRGTQITVTSEIPESQAKLFRIASVKQICAMKSLYGAALQRALNAGVWSKYKCETPK